MSMKKPWYTFPGLQSSLRHVFKRKKIRATNNPSASQSSVGPADGTTSNEKHLKTSSQPAPPDPPTTGVGAIPVSSAQPPPAAIEPPHINTPALDATKTAPDAGAPTLQSLADKTPNPGNGHILTPPAPPSATVSDPKTGSDKESKEAIVMVVMGATGVGKSTFIQSFKDSYSVEAKDTVHHDLDAGTKVVEVHEFDLQGVGRLVLVDTPGFDDPERSNAVVLACIADYLTDTYRKGKLLDGLIYLHRITDIRFDAGSSAALNIFRKLYGSEGYTRLALVTTMWNDIQPQKRGKYEEKEEELKANAWAGFLNREDHAIVRRYEHEDLPNPEGTGGTSTNPSAVNVVSDLLTNAIGQDEKTKNKKLTLRLQQEMVVEGKALPRTEAGRAAFTLTETAKFYLGQITN